MEEEERLTIRNWGEEGKWNKLEFSKTRKYQKIKIYIKLDSSGNVSGRRSKRMRRLRAED